MKLDPKVVAELAIPFRPSAYLRVMPKVHAGTPLGMGFGQTRFSAPDNSFKVLYIARDIATAIAETIVRDRFEGRAKRILDFTEVDDWALSEVSTTGPLTVLDLRTTGLLRLGVSTNASRAKNHATGRRLSHALYHRFAIDGILYALRLTSAECVAVYDRAVPAKLVSTDAESLVRNPHLIDALQSLNVTVRTS
ncbi:RES family NAD+ phosphorylase [Aminobacter sp. J44]|uniref:RES family NAD+ phosphorylase n=1 Tax=Aminobacter sp. J44 TaxID=935262 RepID=UPI001199F089|nr:RES family NAD+ phosphorylase [Aminobacter sp. J44]TWG55299.1 RES domain-containing protein [Aminobacter sp. J44]